jgi:hypothetical protein
MPYLDVATFQYFYEHRTVSEFPGTTEFNKMVSGFTAEFNRFHNVNSDICSISDTTNESYLHGKFMSDLIEEMCNYIRNQKTIPPDLRAEIPPPSLFDDYHTHIRTALAKERREEKPVAYNYNMRTGRIRRWYG